MFGALSIGWLRKGVCCGLMLILSLAGFRITLAASNVSTFARQREQAPLTRIYLPLLAQPGVPDLVPQMSISPSKTSFSAGEPVTITVVVTNQGDAPAGSFWVDLFITPLAPPTRTNMLWHDYCGLDPCFGIVWGVREGLAPGQSVTLSSQAPAQDYTRWPGWFAAGTNNLYVYVDSWNPDVLTGAVIERNEADNRDQIHGLTVQGPTPPVPPLSRDIPRQRVFK